MKKTTTVVQPGDAPAEADASVPPPPPPPAAEPEPLPDNTDDLLDDLFNDTPAKPKKAPAARPAARPAPAPRPRGPVTVVTYELEGPFTPNPASKRLVEKINSVRTSIETKLRGGGYYFFGSRYSDISGDSVAARRVIEPLPALMKASTTQAEFDAALRRSGQSLMPPALREDLFANKLSAVSLAERVKKLEEERQWKKVMGGSM